MIIRAMKSAIVIATACVSSVLAQDHAKDLTHDQQLAWWKAQRFGMFIHWGPVALTGKEIGWSRGQGKPPVLPYDTLYKAFNPAGFNADTWVQIAMGAGMKYLVFTSKHMDGFCEFNSALTAYKITAPESPFGRDVVKELSDACHKAGMGLGFYYIPEDWYSQPIMSATDYVSYYTGQVVNELLSNYGRVDIIWFDNGPRYGGKTGADAKGLLQAMRAKQPWILINNRGDTGPLADFLTPEQVLGAFDTVRTWESCMTIDGANQWAWNPDGGVKTLKQLLGMVVGCADGGGNCLLNVGPRPDGIIDPPMVTRLRQIGAWMSKYGESVYGTRGGPIPRGHWGGTTHRNDTMYVHLVPFAGTVTIPPVNATIVSAASLSGGAPVITQSEDGVSITLPQQNQDSVYTVLKMRLDYSRPVFRYRNVAAGKPATQSSTYMNSAAGRAVDGNTDGYFSGYSVTHTDSTPNSWWMVDLGAVYSIDNIAIYGRTDCCKERLRNYTVSILDQSQARVWSSLQTAAPDPMTRIPAGQAKGRFVRVELNGTGYLSLAEVMVNVDPVTAAGAASAPLSARPPLSGTRAGPHYFLSAESRVRMDYFGCNGKKLGTAFDGPQRAGTYRIAPPARRCGTAFAIYRLTIDGRSSFGRMITAP